MDYRIFNVRTGVNVCDCTEGCTDTARESALKVDCEKIPRPTRESSLRRSAACRPDALLTELHPHPFYDIDSVCAHAGFNLDSGVTTPTSPCLPFPSLPIFLVAEVPGNKTITTSSSQPLHNSLWLVLLTHQDLYQTFGRSSSVSESTCIVLHLPIFWNAPGLSSSYLNKRHVREGKMWEMLHGLKGTLAASRSVSLYMTTFSYSVILNIEEWRWMLC